MRAGDAAPLTGPADATPADAAPGDAAPGGTAPGGTAPAEVRLPSTALVVLVGPSGSGKSTWAARWFDDGEVVSSDAIRAMVGESEGDQRASRDAFDVLDLVVERRLRRRLLTVVDTSGSTSAAAARTGAWRRTRGCRASPSPSTRPPRSAWPATGPGPASSATTW